MSHEHVTRELGEESEFTGIRQIASGKAYSEEQLAKSIEEEGITLDKAHQHYHAAMRYYDTLGLDEKSKECREAMKRVLEKIASKRDSPKKR